MEGGIFLAIIAANAAYFFVTILLPVRDIPDNVYNVFYLACSTLDYKGEWNNYVKSQELPEIPSCSMQLILIHALSQSAWPSY